MSDDSGSFSEFNEAAFKMGRIGEIQKGMNASRLQPFTFFPELNSYGYQIRFNEAVNGLNEVLPHLTDPEIKEGTTLHEGLDEFMDKYPLVIVKKTLRGNTQTFIDYPAWKIFKKHLNVFEAKVRVYLKKHKMDTPTQEAQGLF